MGLFVEQAVEGAYQWGHFTLPGILLIVICLLVSLAAVLFCAVAIRRAEWDDKDAILSVLMAVAVVVSLSIWYVLFAGRLLDYHESNIPSANRVILFTFASMFGSALAALAGGVMMNLEWLTFWKDSTQDRSAQRARTVAGGRPQVTQGINARRGTPPSSPQNIGADVTTVGSSNPASGRAPASGSQEGTLIQGRPGGAPGRAPVSGSQEGTLIQGRPGGAPGRAPASGSQEGTLIQGRPGGAPGRAPASGSQEGTLIQGRPGGAPGRAPASGSQEGTLVEGAANPARRIASGGGLPSDRTQVDGGASGFGLGMRGGPADATMAPGGLQPAALLHLDVVAGPAAGSSYNLQEGSNTLGRSPNSELLLDDPMVSRSHAMVRVSDGETFLVDLGSRGGTRVGNRQVEGHSLDVGGIMTVGQSSMMLMAMDGMATPSNAGGETMVGTPVGAVALVVQSGPDTSKVFPLREGPNIVGRDVSADVQMSDQQVSRRHAVVTIKEGRVTVSDIGSTYGTAINGRNLEGTKLRMGDHVFVGQSELVLTGPGV